MVKAKLYRHKGRIYSITDIPTSQSLDRYLVIFSIIYANPDFVSQRGG